MTMSAMTVPKGRACVEPQRHAIELRTLQTTTSGPEEAKPVTGRMVSRTDGQGRVGHAGRRTHLVRARRS